MADPTTVSDTFTISFPMLIAGIGALVVGVGSWFIRRQMDKNEKEEQDYKARLEARIALVEGRCHDLELSQAKQVTREEFSELRQDIKDLTATVLKALSAILGSKEQS